MDPRGKRMPLGSVTPKFEREESLYPDILMVAMDDGRVIRYRRTDSERRQNPAFVEAMELLKRLPVYGGRKHRRAHKEPGL